MQFIGFIAILILALSACSGMVIHAHFSLCSHRTLVTVDSQVLGYAGHFYELSTYGMGSGASYGRGQFLRGYERASRDNVGRLGDSRSVSIHPYTAVLGFSVGVKFNKDLQVDPWNRKGVQCRHSLGSRYAEQCYWQKSCLFFACNECLCR